MKSSGLKQLLSAFILIQGAIFLIGLLLPSTLNQTHYKNNRIVEINLNIGSFTYTDYKQELLDDAANDVNNIDDRELNIYSERLQTESQTGRSFKIISRYLYSDSDRSPPWDSHLTIRLSYRVSASVINTF